LCFCSVFLRLVDPMLPVSLDCSLLIALSVFSNVFYMLSCILMMVFVKLFWLINTYPEVNILTHSLIR